MYKPRHSAPEPARPSLSGDFREQAVPGQPKDTVATDVCCPMDHFNSRITIEMMHCKTLGVANGVGGEGFFGMGTLPHLTRRPDKAEQKNYI